MDILIPIKDKFEGSDIQYKNHIKTEFEKI